MIKLNIFNRSICTFEEYAGNSPNVGVFAQQYFCFRQDRRFVAKR